MILFFFCQGHRTIVKTLGREFSLMSENTQGLYINFENMLKIFPERAEKFKNFKEITKDMDEETFINYLVAEFQSLGYKLTAKFPDKQ